MVAWKRTDEVGGISKGHKESLGVMDMFTIHYLSCGDSFMGGTHMSKLIKLYTLNISSLLYVNYSSIKLLIFENHYLATILNSWLRVIIDSGKNNQWMLKLMDVKMFKK